MVNGKLDRDATDVMWAARSTVRTTTKADSKGSAAPPPSLAEAGSAPAPSGLSLAEERALLAREQRIGFELKNALARGEYAPISLLAQVLATASQSVAERMEALPARVRRRCPLLPAKAMDEVTAVINEARNEWVRQTAELVAASLAVDDDDEAAPCTSTAP